MGAYKVLYSNNNSIQRRKSRFFLQSLYCAANRLQLYAQVARAQLRANRVQHIERLSRATCRVTCHLVRRDSSAIKFDKAEIAFFFFFLALFYWLNQ